ncbi:ester cyclase [Natronolimnobius baerhuensis]|uniref:Ester cyclase n=1 Tax=Natronolimnobius baerhuensis TaxID=253108 RepID=A0A202EAL3_9EURY|nr:ester cyclase [Natronolimnobius baerhuensis]OVE85208.1 ester cyclase [Natronolimnobius baerhuensis]
MATDKIALVRRDPEEVWTEGNLETIDEIFAADFVLHDPSSADDSKGRDEYRAYVEAYREAFPDVEYEVEHVLAEDDTVALRYTAHGTHDGEFMGLEPTGDQVSVSGMEMYRIEDEQIAEMWTSYDALGLFQELGVVPPLEDLGESADPA